MSKMVLVFALITMSFQAFARGGDELLNGGDGLVCAYGNARTYELLDLYEGQVLHGFSYQRNVTFDTALDKFFNILKRKDPARACLYSRWLKTFWDESKLIYSTFPDIRDEGYRLTPSNCWVEQVALRTFRALPDKKRYLISGKVYDNMNGLDKAALLIHELAYREARLADPKRFSNSQEIRKYVAYIFSKSMVYETPAQYDQVVQEVGLPQGERYCDPKHRIYKTR